MQKENILNEIFSDIKTHTNLALEMLSQFKTKSHIERQESYLCKDVHSKQKYLLVVAFNSLQAERIAHTIQNYENNILFWEQYFNIHKPVYYQTNKQSFILYTYLENTSRLDNTDKSLEKTINTIYEQNSYQVNLNEDKINEIMNSIVNERCNYDENTKQLFIENSAFQNYKKLLSGYTTIQMVKTHGDMKYQNILIHNNKKYLIGFEFGGIDLPIGFDLYCLRRMNKETNFDDIPYKELHECLYEIHHVSNKADWLHLYNPIIKINIEKRKINVQENNKEFLINIEKPTPQTLIIDFKNTELSPAAIALLVQNKCVKRYSVVIKNCPFWFNGLKQEHKNKLLFSGKLKRTETENNYKNIFEYLKNSQAYINYSRILPYVKPYWFRALLAILICIPIGSLDAVIALSLKPYMDLVMVEKSVQSPWYIPLAIVAFTTIQGLLNYTATYLNTWVGGKITNDLKRTLYQKMLTFEPSFFDRRKSGDIVFRFNSDAESACNGLLDNLKTFVSRLFSSLSLICVLFYNSWQLALIASIVLGCAFLPLGHIRNRIKGVMDASVAVSSTIITAYNESFAGNKTIAAYNLAKHQKNKFDKILSNIFSLRIKLVQRTSWLSPMMHIIVSIGIGLAIWYGSHLILTKQITSGNFVSFITALIMLYTPIKNLGNNFNAVQFSFMAIERVFSILNLKPAISNKENAIALNCFKSEICFKDVNFAYTKNKPVLKHINLTVKKGNTIAIVGNSGGGKTTLVNLLPRFYDVKSGSISIDGIDIRDYTLESLRQNIAVVFQDNFLFSGTIRENILLGNENATEKQINLAAKMAYLDEFIASLHEGLDTQIGERGILLSGGQKQRVAIARAFLKDAPIIILDEATSALDNKAEAVVQKAIDNLMKDKTVFVIAHRLSTIRNADKIAVINEGELVELGNHDELMSIEKGQYKALYDMQFKKQEVNV